MTAVDSISYISLWISRNPMLLMYVAIVAIILYGIIWAYANNLIG